MKNMQKPFRVIHYFEKSPLSFKTSETKQQMFKTSDVFEIYRSIYDNKGYVALADFQNHFRVVFYDLLILS